MAELDEHVLEELYTWIDEVPLSRPKRELKRDFSDGVLVAEVVKHFHPNLVELHNYSSALAVNKKIINWHILNRKVFKRMGFEVNEDVIKNIVNCQPFAVEQLLLLLRRKIEQLSERRAKSDDPEVDQDELAYRQDPSLRRAVSNQLNSQRAKAPGAGANKSSGSIIGGRVVAPGGMKVSQKDTDGIHKQGDILIRQLLAEKDEQLNAKDETIEILQAKIGRLEQLLKLKDIRIEDLQARLTERITEMDQRMTAATMPPAQPPAPVPRSTIK